MEGKSNPLFVIYNQAYADFQQALQYHNETEKYARELVRNSQEQLQHARKLMEKARRKFHSSCERKKKNRKCQTTGVKVIEPCYIIANKIQCSANDKVMFPSKTRTHANAATQTDFTREDIHNDDALPTGASISPNIITIAPQVTKKTSYISHSRVISDIKVTHNVTIKTKNNADVQTSAIENYNDLINLVRTFNFIYKNQLAITAPPQQNKRELEKKEERPSKRPKLSIEEKRAKNAAKQRAWRARQKEKKLLNLQQN